MTGCVVGCNPALWRCKTTATVRPNVALFNLCSTADMAVDCDCLLTGLAIQASLDCFLFRNNDYLLASERENERHRRLA